MGRIKILASIEWYTPAFRAGGIISSLVNQVAHLSSEFDFWIVCSHRDLLGPMPEIDRTDCWIQQTRHQVLYCSQSPNWSRILNEAKPDIIYVNGIFNGPFCRALLSSAGKTTIPVVLAAHGMLSPNALAIKWWLKKPWLWLNQKRDIFRNVVWHASSTTEKQQINHWFPGAHIKVAQNLPPSAAKNITAPSEKLEFLSVGRIHPIKNYGFAAECLAALTQKLNIPASYHLIGPAEDEQERDQILKHAGGLLSIELLGEKKPSDLANHYQRATCLLVPSLTENYGVVVAEAMGNGLPAVVSDQTPWGTFPPSPALHCLPLDQDKWVNTLAELSEENLRKNLISIAQSYFEAHLINEEIRNQHRALFS